MAAIDFPNSPTTGDVFTVGNVSWTWTGAVWQGIGIAFPVQDHATTHELGGTDELELAQSQITDLPTFSVTDPVNAQALVYDEVAEEWVNSAVSGESFSPLLLMGA
jgi:hypothetical protein